jgi:hypothetical protein
MNMFEVLISFSSRFRCERVEFPRYPDLALNRKQLHFKPSEHASKIRLNTAHVSVNRDGDDGFAFISRVSPFGWRASVDIPIEFIGILLACSVHKHHQHIPIYLLMADETTHLLSMDQVSASTLHEISVLFLSHTKQSLPENSFRNRQPSTLRYHSNLHNLFYFLCSPILTLDCL